MENLNLEQTKVEKDAATKIVEQQDSRSGAFHLFLYLTSFLSLGFIFFGLVSILFGFFNKTLAGDDPLMDVFDQSSVRTAIAFLVISTPIYYFLLGFVNKKLFSQEIKLASGVRKVLTYFSLFILSVIIIGDLISLLSSFLNGDYTELFLAKALTLLFLAGGFGAFYFWEIRRKEIEKKNFSLWKNGILALAVVVLIGGFSIIDKPSVAREKRLDGQIVNQMGSLQDEVTSFYLEKEKNPTLEELINRASGAEKTALESGKIEYQPQDSGVYNLCATFNQAWDGDERISGIWADSLWKHPQGRYCFEIKENLEAIDAQQTLGGEKPLMK